MTELTLDTVPAEDQDPPKRKDLLQAKTEVLKAN